MFTICSRIAVNLDQLRARPQAFFISLSVPQDESAYQFCWCLFRFATSSPLMQFGFIELRSNVVRPKLRVLAAPPSSCFVKYRHRSTPLGRRVYGWKRGFPRDSHSTAYLSDSQDGLLQSAPRFPCSSLRGVECHNSSGRSTVPRLAYMYAGSHSNCIPIPSCNAERDADAILDGISGTFSSGNSVVRDC